MGDAYEAMAATDPRNVTRHIPAPATMEIRGVTLTEQRARGVRYNVVACKKPSLWIVRAMASFLQFETLFKAVAHYTGTIDPELEWTYATYSLPSYMAYGSGDIPDMRGTPYWPNGVYIFHRQDKPKVDTPLSAYGDGHFGNARRLGDIPT